MSCDSSICSESDCSCRELAYEILIQKYLQEEREPIPIRPIPKILKPPHYDQFLTKNQRILRNFVVNIRNLYLAYCLLNRKGLEYMVAIHRCKENAVIKAGGYPYCEGDYIASEYFNDFCILYPSEMKPNQLKLLEIISKVNEIAGLLKSMWVKLSLLDEMNREDVTFKQWTWEAIEFAFEILYRAFWRESQILESLASTMVHTSNFSKLKRCLQMWCEQRGIKDEDLDLLKTLLKEVGVKEPQP